MQTPNAYYYPVWLWLRGKIFRETVGKHGFSYGLIFYVLIHVCTSTELTPEIKNTISHKAKTLTGLLEELKAC